jgi:energy-coupling factor transport system permease protein
MLNNIKIGRYYHTKSLIHDMNPLAKIICIFTFVFISLIVNTLLLNLVVSLIVLFVIGLTHIPLSIYLKSIYGLRILIIFIIIINLIMGINLVTISLIIIRLISLVLYTTILTLTTTPNDITYGLEMFFTPLKVFGFSTRRFALTISLALRFIPTIIDQANRVLKALTSRGMNYTNSTIKSKIEAFKALLMPMFILSFKRADTLAESMEVRLYDINQKRTNYRVTKWNSFDLYVVMMHILILIVIMIKGVI